MPNKDIQKIREDLRRTAGAIQKLKKQVPAFVAGAAEKMKDANFSAEGFVSGGSAKPRWAKRKAETRRSSGKRILHSTGYMQSNVRAKAALNQVRVGADLSKVPYAKLHNEGGRVVQYVRAHHRKHWKTGKRYQVQPYARWITMPQRKFLGYSPDIEKIVKKELDYELKRILK